MVFLCTWKRSSSIARVYWRSSRTSKVKWCNARAVSFGLGWLADLVWIEPTNLYFVRTVETVERGICSTSAMSLHFNFFFRIEHNVRSPFVCQSVLPHFENIPKDLKTRICGNDEGQRWRQKHDSLHIAGWRWLIWPWDKEYSHLVLNLMHSHWTL